MSSSQYPDPYGRLEYIIPHLSESALFGRPSSPDQTHCKNGPRADMDISYASATGIPLPSTSLVGAVHPTRRWVSGINLS